LDGEQLRIHKAVATPEPELPALAGAAPGTITVSRNGSVLVACGTGALTLIEVAIYQVGHTRAPPFAAGFTTGAVVLPAATFGG